METFEKLALSCPRGTKHFVAEAYLGREISLSIEWFGGVRCPVRMFGKKAFTAAGLIKKARLLINGEKRKGTGVPPPTILVAGPTKMAVSEAIAILTRFKYRCEPDPNCCFKRRD